MGAPRGGPPAPSPPPPGVPRGSPWGDLTVGPRGGPLEGSCGGPWGDPWGSFPRDTGGFGHRLLGDCDRAPRQTRNRHLIPSTGLGRHRVPVGFHVCFARMLRRLCALPEAPRLAPGASGDGGLIRSRAAELGRPACPAPPPSLKCRKSGLVCLVGIVARTQYDCQLLNFRQLIWVQLMNISFKI